VSIAKETYDALFRRPLSVWPAALLLGTLNILLFAYEKPWTASDGIRNWGDWFFQSIGASSQAQLLPPWLYSGSVLNVGLLAGAFVAALLSRQFAVQVAPAAELAKGFIGGLLMGLGAIFAMGCNIGGFYSALSALSLSGLGMMIGLTIGAFIGIRYVMWEAEHWPRLSSGNARAFFATKPEGRSVQPWLGGLSLVVIVVIVTFYAQHDFAQRGGLLLFGVLLGMILQRSRFCLVRAFREPFLTGDSEMTRAAVLSLLVSLIGFAVLKGTDLRSTGTFVFPAFWKGSVIGGVIFGVGMVLAGGCGAGSIWRAGEGHLKLWCAVFGFAISASLVRRFMEQGELLRHLGKSVFLPDLTGWPLALAIIVAVLLAWYLFAAWNEKSQKFVAG
jgi:hypothetical protein